MSRLPPESRGPEASASVSTPIPVKILRDHSEFEPIPSNIGFAIPTRTRYKNKAEHGKKVCDSEESNLDLHGHNVVY